MSAAETENMLRKSVALAVAVRDEFRAAQDTDSLIAASVGPYAAARADGSEYHGNYGCTRQELEHFHRRRMQVLASTGADLLACETIPSLEEAEAILLCLREQKTARAWFSFTCGDEQHTVHGERITDCARLLDAEPQVVAIGVNCTAPKLITLLIRHLRTATKKPIVVYPNAGRTWDAVNRCWLGTAECADLAVLAREWWAEGARWIGGCCGTTPESIRGLRAGLGV